MNDKRWIDATYFLGTFGTDSTARDELVGLFRKVSAQQMDALAAALTKGDWDGVAREAHALKGSLGLFGAHETIGLLEDLEEACEGARRPAIRTFAEELIRRMPGIVEEVSALGEA